MPDAEVDANAYADAEWAAKHGEGLTDKERADYLRMRHEQVKQAYKNLQLQKWEAKSTDNKQLLAKINEVLSENYDQRKWIVKALRELGEAVEDKIVP